nr:hypothetical protein [Tanacetum cinerariifolium]
MTTLANKAILLGADNRPPLLEKDMYCSWKSIMELYMMNRQHGGMILESVENGPLIWPMIEENGVTRPRKYSELTPAKAIQDNCNDTELPSTEDIQPLQVQEPPHNFDMHQLIEECSTEVSEEQKQSMEDMMLELVKICQEKEFLCIHDDVNDLIESALNSKLLLINSNSQRLDKKGQEVKNVVEQPAEPENHNIQSLYITPETESDEVTESNAKNLLPILSECEVTLEDKRECDVPISKKSPICDNHSDIFSDSKDDDDISVYDDFEDVEYVEASLPDPEIEEMDFEDISQIQDIVLHAKLLTITHLISNIESLNDISTPDRVLNSFESDNSLLDNFPPGFKTFCDHTKVTRSGNTTHADNSLPEYDPFFFEIEPDQERLINLMKNDIPGNSSNNSLLKEADLFLASDNSIPPGEEIPVVMNVKDKFDEDYHYFIFDKVFSLLSAESEDMIFDPGEEIPVVMNVKDKFDEDYHYFIFDKVFSLLSAESEDMIFDPANYNLSTRLEKIGEDLACLLFDIILSIPKHCFNKFAYKNGETLRDFYLRFSLLLNDMNIYNVKLEQFQVNTKFLNTLPPEWSKFVTDVKLVRDLHPTNIDQLYAYLGQHEFHANDVRLMHERNSDLLALVVTHKMTQKRDDSWFKDKVLLVQAQANGQILHEEELAFLADEGIAEGQATQTNYMNSSYPSPSCRPTEVKVPKELPKVSMEQGLIIAALHDELMKLKGKALVDNAVTTHTINPEMLKVVVEPLAFRLLNNRTVHSDYLRLTQKQATILKEVVEQAKILKSSK